MRRYILLISIVLWWATHEVSAATELPDTPAGQRAGEVLEMLNEADAERARAYIEEDFSPAFRDAFPMPMHLGFFTGTRTMFGALEVFRVSESAEHAIDLVLKSQARESYLRLELTVEPSSPFRIAVLGIGPAEPPPARADSGPGTVPGRVESDGEPADLASADWDRVHRVLSRRAAAGEFSGAVLVAQGGEALFQRAYGMASREQGAANRPDTRFNLGSLNKLFTSVAIAQLVQQGLLGIDDPIGAYLEGFPAEIADRVSVRHLLQMRAGWGDYWQHEYFLEHRGKLREVAHYLAFIRDMPLDFEPGTDRQHCNTCFEVLGALVEAASGMNYYDYIVQHVYRPAGMTHSGSFDRDDDSADLATGYTNMNGQGEPGEGYRFTNEQLLSPRGTPAGGGYSTVGDMLRFDQALRGFRLLDRPHTEFLLAGFEGQPGDGFDPRGMARAMGGAPGIGALYGRDWNSGVTIVVLSNLDFPAVIESYREISGILGLD